MSDKCFSRSGKKLSENGMSSVALNEARGWADQLMEAETHSRREKEYRVRERLSSKIGVSPSYLFRLQYKTEEMNDVKGSVYRALIRACGVYGIVCTFIENATDRIDREAEEIEETNEITRRATASMARMEAPPQGKEGA